MPLQIDIHEYENTQYAKLMAAIELSQNVWLQELIDKNIDFNLVFTSYEFDAGYTPSPLMVAVRANNAYATRYIANKLLTQGTLNLSEEAYSESLFHHGIRTGNPEIVRYLLSYKADPNIPSNEETPIMTCVRKLPTFSLINEGEWGADVNKADLLAWYNDPKKEFPKNASALTWKGSLGILEQILKAGADVTIPDNFGLSALDLINTVNDPKHLKRKMFQDDNCKLEFVNADQDQITFKTYLKSRDTKREQAVTVTYDVREVRKLLEKYSDANKNKGYDSKRLKEVETSLANHKLDTETKLDADKEARELKSRIKMIEENKNTEKFYDLSQNRIKVISDAYKLISSGLMQRTKISNLDTAVSVLGALKQHVPSVLKLPFSIFETLLSTGANNKEMSRCTKIDRLIPSDTLEFTKKLVCDLTEGLIKHANTLRPGVIDKLSIEDMELLSHRIVIIIIAKLHDVDKLHIDPKLSAKDRTQLLVNKFLENDKASETFVELLEERIKKTITPPSTPVQTAAFDLSKARAEKQAAKDKAAKNSEFDSVKKDKCVVM